MKKLNKTEAAKYLGVTRRTVYNLVKRGDLLADENGLIVLTDESIPEEWENTQKNSQSVKSVLETSERLKDKYIAHLEQQIVDLREELKKTKQELEHTKRTLEETPYVVLPLVWRNVIREFIATKPENLDQVFEIIRKVVLAGDRKSLPEQT